MFTREQVERQVELICKYKRLQGSILLKLLLKFLAERAFNQPDPEQEGCRATNEQIAQVLEPVLRRVDLARGRAELLRLRCALRDFYKQVPDICGAIYVDIPDSPYHRLGRYYCTLALLSEVRSDSAMRCEAVSTFWRSWTKKVQDNQLGRSPFEVLIVFSNEQPELGEHEDVSGKYSGSGEVIGSWLLSAMFTHLKLEAHIARSRSLTCALPPSNTVRIYLGGSLANHGLNIVRRHPRWAPRQKFQFDDTSGIRRIVNRKVQQGEPEYFAYEKKDGYDIDYSLISFFYDRELNVCLVGLGGITTFGTEEAARFVCEEKTLSLLLKHLKSSGADDTQDLEIVREVVVYQGQPTGRKTFLATSPESMICLE